jgi:hypothetical protein
MSGEDYAGNRFPRKLIDLSGLKYESEQKGSQKSAPHLPVKSWPFSDMCAGHLGTLCDKSAKEPVVFLNR